LTTQLIIGFPSETEDDFNATLDLIKEIKFSGVSLFPYYDAPHTPASKMRGKINEEVITSRMNKARDLLFKEKVMSL
jgi:tRNA-2-methylthio-N6-dimethylallyladenosine synthase